MLVPEHSFWRSFRCENRVVEFCLPLIFPEFAELYECVRVYLRTSVHSPFSRFFVCVSLRFKEIVHAFHFANKLEQEQTAFSFSIFVFSTFENGSHVFYACRNNRIRGRKERRSCWFRLKFFFFSIVLVLLTEWMNERTNENKIFFFILLKRYHKYQHKHIHTIPIIKNKTRERKTSLSINTNSKLTPSQPVSTQH